MTGMQCIEYQASQKENVDYRVVEVSYPWGFNLPFLWQRLRHRKPISFSTSNRLWCFQTAIDNILHSAYSVMKKAKSLATNDAEYGDYVKGGNSLRICCPPRISQSTIRVAP